MQGFGAGPRTRKAELRGMIEPDPPQPRRCSVLPTPKVATRPLASWVPIATIVLYSPFPGENASLASPRLPIDPPSRGNTTRLDGKSRAAPLAFRILE